MPPAQPPLMPACDSNKTDDAESKSVKKDKAESDTVDSLSPAGGDSPQNTDPGPDLAVVLWDEIHAADGAGALKTQDEPAAPNASKDLN